MKLLLLITVIIGFSISASAQNRRSEDTVIVNNKNTPQDTLAPFDRSTNKHIEVPDPNRPKTNATPVIPEKEKNRRRKP